MPYPQAVRRPSASSSCSSTEPLGPLVSPSSDVSYPNQPPAPSRHGSNYHQLGKPSLFRLLWFFLISVFSGFSGGMEINPLPVKKLALVHFFSRPKHAIYSKSSHTTGTRYPGWGQLPPGARLLPETRMIRSSSARQSSRPEMYIQCAFECRTPDRPPRLVRLNLPILVHCIFYLFYFRK